MLRTCSNQDQLTFIWPFISSLLLPSNRQIPIGYQTFILFISPIEINCVVSQALRPDNWHNLHCYYLLPRRSDFYYRSIVNSKRVLWTWTSHWLPHSSLFHASLRRLLMLCKSKMIFFQRRKWITFGNTTDSCRSKQRLVTLFAEKSVSPTPLQTVSPRSIGVKPVRRRNRVRIQIGGQTSQPGSSRNRRIPTSIFSWRAASMLPTRTESLSSFSMTILAQGSAMARSRSRSIPVEEGRLVYFNGNVIHSTVVENGSVHLLGPFTGNLRNLQSRVGFDGPTLSPTTARLGGGRDKASKQKSTKAPKSTKAKGTNGGSFWSAASPITSTDKQIEIISVPGWLNKIYIKKSTIPMGGRGKGAIPATHYETENDCHSLWASLNKSRNSYVVILHVVP